MMIYVVIMGDATTQQDDIDVVCAFTNQEDAENYINTVSIPGFFLWYTEIPLNTHYKENKNHEN